MVLAIGQFYESKIAPTLDACCKKIVELAMRIAKIAEEIWTRITAGLPSIEPIENFFEKAFQFVFGVSEPKSSFKANRSYQTCAISRLPTQVPIEVDHLNLLRQALARNNRYPVISPNIRAQDWITLCDEHPIRVQTLRSCTKT